jgi:hypothetical protein
MTDTLRDGRYAIVGVLGEGGQGRTFDGIDKSNGQPVAIKRFDVRGARAWKDVELAERETRVLQSLSHPRLPRYVDHFEENGILYLVTVKVDGSSLESLRRRGAPFAERDALRLLHDAAEVLGYLHGRSPPVVHRDIKPGNVLRRPDGSYAFVDFGAVRDTLRPEGGSTVVGTFGYMAPEQFEGRALPASDVYGVGATVVSLLSGTEPESLPHRGLAIDVRAALRGRASDRMIRVLERLLEPDPDRRPSRIDSVLDGSSYSYEPGQGRTGRHARRQEARQARRAALEAARAERRARRDRYGVPWPLEVIFTLVFAAGLVAVALVTQVALPLMLRVLSVLFARRALSTAADAVQQAGGAAVRAMVQSRRWMRGDPGGPADGPRAREAVDTPPPTRVAPAPNVRVNDADTASQGATGDEADPVEDDASAVRGKR